MRTLYIIGNGFDLANGVRSSYRDFREHLLSLGPEGVRMAVTLESYLGSSPDLWGDFEESLGFLDRGMAMDSVDDAFDDHGDVRGCVERGLAGVTSIEEELPRLFRSWLRTLRPKPCAELHPEDGAALGIAQAAIDDTVKYTKERIQFGKRISQFQNTQFQLADMQAKVDAARLLIYRAAQAKQDHEPYSHLAAMGKLYASEAASDVTRRCLQLIGGYGYTREYPFERFMRDAKITEIYEGTSEVQRMVIAAWMGVK